MKLKTHKTTAKKVKVTKGKKKKKFMTKHAGQDHFNARETGSVGRRKKRGKQVAKVDQKTIKNLLPYS
ncbi:MAG: 50S ribosomal protein L35 [Parcubacteria group bacterium]|jgi:ribosomal protein L35|nr:50S ribosomal protein L35 [Parcubacteria group bacterium]|tara:strand:+ start:1476 stop:1679 length:204 start_codon:yes stop_codon:yes gene_type:complete